MQLSPASADQVGHDVARDAKHRRVRTQGGAEGRTRVQHAWSRNHGERTNPACCLGIAICHVGGTLFVSRMDESDLVAGTMERVVEIVHMNPGYAEHGVYAVFNKGSRDCFRGCFRLCHFLHNHDCSRPTDCLAGQLFLPFQLLINMLNKATGCRPYPGKSGRLAKAVFSAFDQPSEMAR
ncbi:hypothetical protein MPLB_180075 [Mesorhizobium sp. ORS 3324]|nr:hypothetical protein MPLB_180075 [Mesorhizobium sp. ORS 3324]